MTIRFTMQKRPLEVVMFFVWHKYSFGVLLSLIVWF